MKPLSPPFPWENGAAVRLNVSPPNADKHLMRTVLFLLLLLAPLSGGAADRILMLNLNYSSAELRALEEVARARGQQVEMVPPREMIPAAERLFEMRMALEKKVKESGLSEVEAKSLVSDYMRSGSSSRHPEITQRFPSEIQQLRAATQAQHEAEKSLGTLRHQLEAKAQELRQAGHRVDSVVFSAHSDGVNLSGETSLHLSGTDIGALATSHRNLFGDARHVMLMGCYNMTEQNHERWRWSLFPKAALVAGFGVRAPSRYQRASVNFLTNVLNKATELDNQLAARGQTLTPAAIQAHFRSLSSVTNQQSVIDYCGAITEGLPGSRNNISCNEQWQNFDLRASAIEREYLRLLPPGPAADPPREDVGMLRDFYNYIQRICPARNSTWLPREESAGAERRRLYLRESLIRLIYWWEVQKNYRAYFQNDIRALDTALSQAGVRSSAPALDGTTPRTTFVKWYNDTYQAIRAKRSEALGRNDAQVRAMDALQRRLENTFKPLYNLRGEESAGGNGSDAVETTLARGGVPIGWLQSAAAIAPRSSR